MTKTLTLAVFVALLASCSRNNGGNADLYGNWKLTAITSQGVTDNPEATFWSFQNTTIRMYAIVAPHWTTDAFGNYSLSDDRLALDFPDIDGGGGAPLLGLPRQCVMTVVRLDRSRLELRYAPASGEETTYTFTKW